METVDLAIGNCPNCHNDSMNIAHNHGAAVFDTEGYIKLYCSEVSCEDRMSVISSKYCKIIQK